MCLSWCSSLEYIKNLEYQVLYFVPFPNLISSYFFHLAFPLPTIYQTRRRVVLNNMVLHLKTLTLNPFPDEDDLAVYEPAKHSQLLTLRSSQKYFFPEQSYVDPVAETESLSAQIRKVLL